MKYEQMTILQKLDFWVNKYDINLYFERFVSSATVHKGGSKIREQHDTESPSKTIESIISHLEKSNPKAIRDHDKEVD